MSRKSKGINAERALIHMFWAKDWAATRVAASGSIKYPVPDVIAGNGNRSIAIEVKTSKAKHKYFTKEEISQLKQFCTIFGAEPLVAIKFNNVPWSFLKLENLQEKNSSYLANLKIISAHGLSFEDLVK